MTTLQPKHAKLSAVGLSTFHGREVYPFFVAGWLTLANGKTETFAWHVPDLNWGGFDWSSVQIKPDVAAKMVELQTAQEIWISYARP